MCAFCALWRVAVLVEPVWGAPRPPRGKPSPSVNAARIGNTTQLAVVPTASRENTSASLVPPPLPRNVSPVPSAPSAPVAPQCLKYSRVPRTTTATHRSSPPSIAPASVRRATMALVQDLPPVHAEGRVPRVISANRAFFLKSAAASTSFAPLAPSLPGKLQTSTTAHPSQHPQINGQNKLYVSTATVARVGSSPRVLREFTANVASSRRATPWHRGRTAQKVLQPQHQH